MTLSGLELASAVQISPGFAIRHHENVTMLDFNIADTGTFEKWFLISADRHFDNAKTNRHLMRRHLEEAQQRNAHVLDFGDFYCAMQGKFDPRSSKSDLLEENKKTGYLDSLIDVACDWHDPFMKLFLLLIRGNHEGSIYDRCGMDLIRHTVERFRAKGSNVVQGGYSGWIQFNFTYHSTKRVSKRMFYHHGYGGAAPVTKGTIQTNRMSVYLPDADIVVSGHTHGQWWFPIQRVRLSNAGQVYHDKQIHVKIPTYKDAYGTGKSGWEVEKGFAPSPIGAWWMRLFYKNGEFHFEFTEAV